MASTFASTISSSIATTLNTSFNTTYNISLSQQPNSSSSESGLTATYIGLIVALIGLAGTFLVNYNIKTVKLCCVNFECNKKNEKNKEYTLPEPNITIPENTTIILHTEPDNQVKHVVSSETILILQGDHTFVESTF